MDWTANVAVHESASPEFLREQIFSALEQGQVHPCLLYSGLRQTSHWSVLHRAFSPAHGDTSCVAMYQTAFNRAIETLRGNVAHVVSFACGDGSKDVACLREVRASNRAVIYTPVDISLEMVLTASREAAAAVRGLQVTPLLCDLPNCSVMPAILKGFDPAGVERLLLFLGTIHNYWPPDILRSALYPLRSQDQLLISANLAPEEWYELSLQEILKQYDNELTRVWLMGALSELTIDQSHGELHFEIQSSAIPSLKRIEATFTLHRAKHVRIFEREVKLAAGQKLTVFYSHRFTLKHISDFLKSAGLALGEVWVGASGYEGLFLCRRTESP
jgi:uncharacterized SAM-dependent methyltransferase